MPKLTKRTIDAIQMPPDRETFVWDNEVRGFGVRVRASGAGTSVIQYRNAERRSRRLSLGSINILTPEQARALAREKLAAVHKGEDPADEKKALRNSATVWEVCDWYLEQAE